MGKFGNKIVTVTGAGQGVGEKLAIRFYEEGATADLLDLNNQNLNVVAREVNPDTGRLLTYAVDVDDSRQVTSAVNDVGKWFGRIDILTNNAGIPHKGMTESSTDMYMELMVNVNLMGFMYHTRASVPYIKENDGNITNVSSILATFPNMGPGAYGAARAGMIVLTKVQAAELALYKIRVDCYAPGVLNTLIAEDMIKNRTKNKPCQIPLHRFRETDDAFDLVSFFCSDRVSYITGQTIGLDEGVWVTQTPTTAWKL